MTPLRRPTGPDARRTLERQKAFSDAIVAMQSGPNRKFGPGRAFHRQQVAGLTGELRVTTDEPELRQGLFADDGPWPVRIRAVASGPSHPCRSPPDVHGFAMSVRDVDGPGRWPTGPIARTS